MATEKVALLVRAALYKDPDHGIVQYDLKNAYGLISRTLILRALIEEGNKDLIRIFHTRYVRTILLWMRMESGELKKVEVKTGLLQGDTLAPLFFSMGFHIILRRLLQSNEGRACKLMAAFLDDLTATGPLNTLSAMTKRVQPLLDEERSGLVLNWKKTLIFCPTTHANTIVNPPPWKVMGPDEGVRVLGAYIGAPDWVRDALKKEVAEMGDILIDLRRLPAQHALLILRLCVVQQFNFIQRHTPPSLYGAIAAKTHDLIWATLRDILDIPEEGNNLNLARARKIAELPLRQGGLGLLNPVHTKFEAFLAGVGDIIDDLKGAHPEQFNFLVDHLILKPYTEQIPANKIIDRDYFHKDLHKSMEKVKVNIDEGRKKGILKNMSDADIKKSYPSKPAQLLHPHKKLQKSLANLEQDVFYQVFFAKLDDTRRALNLSESSPGASGFLYAVPSSANLYMADETFRAAVRDRLALPPLNGAVPECTNPNCSLSHASTHDADAAARDLRRHRHGVGACARHAMVVKQIREMFRSANIPTTVEPTVQSTPTTLRGDIAETHTHKRGFKTIYDVSITDTTRQDTLNNAAKKAGEAAAESKKYKNNKYLAPCKAINSHFHPLIFESSGYIDKTVFDLITQISRSLHNDAEFIPEYTTWAAPTFKHYWLQRISIAVRGGSAGMSIRNWKQRLTGHSAGL